MSFQWNPSRPGRQVGDRAQQMPQWANQEQYNPGNIPTNQFAFQDTGTSSNDWSPGMPYQWCPSTSQDQMNWACTNYPSNQYNQMLQSNFAPNVYSAYNQSKANYGENFSGMYNESERNSGFDYQMTNSFLTSQGNNSYRVSQNNFLSNCQGPAKVCGNQSTNNFPYWDPARNGSDTINYMPHSMYTNRVCDNISVPNMTMKRGDMEPNHPQDDMMQTYNKKPDLMQQRQVLKPNAADSRFSNSDASDYFMGMMSHDIVSSNMSPIQNDGKNHNFYSPFNSVNPAKEIDASLEPSKYTNNPKGIFSFGNDPRNSLELTSLPKRDGPSIENHLQRRILNLEKRLLEKSSDFEKTKSVSNETKFERSYGEMYNLNAEIKNFESEIDSIESEVKLTLVGHNMPSCIDLNDHGLSCSSEYGLSGTGKNEDRLSAVKLLRQHLCQLKDQVLQQLNVENEPNLHPETESGPSKAKKPDEQTDSAVAVKTSPLKQVRRAVLKYLLRLSGRVEKCFSELRNVKKILKDDPNNKEVFKILQKVGMHINHSRLSLKEKKKLCAKNNIRLRSLTIKSTGTNILQTLESDMFHLRRFYTALNHIAKHLGTIEKVPRENKGSVTDDEKESSSQVPFYSDSDDDCDDLIENETSSSLSFQSESCPVSGSMPSMDQPISKKSNMRDTSFTGPPQKSVRFMVSERSFWDKLMEVSYQIKSKILSLRQAERAYKNGVKGSLAKVRVALSETPRKNLKKEVKQLMHWKKKYNFSRHIPTCILQSYPEQERRSRDKITLKSVRKSLATFMSLCYSTRVLIDSSPPCPEDQQSAMLKEEARYWKRLHILLQKIKMYHSELSKIQLALMANGNDKKNLEALIRIEARVREIENEIVKEEKSKQKNGYNDAMPTNVETEKLKVLGDDFKNVHMIRESFQSLKSFLLALKSSHLVRMPSLDLPSTSTSVNSTDLSIQTHVLEKELPSDLAQFLGDGADDWI